MIFQRRGMMEYIPCYSYTRITPGVLPSSRLASRKILIEQNIKKRTGPALCVLYGCGTAGRITQTDISLGALNSEDSFVPIFFSCGSPLKCKPGSNNLAVRNTGEINQCSYKSNQIWTVFPSRKLRENHTYKYI